RGDEDERRRQLLERYERRNAGEGCRDERHRQRAVPDGDQAFESQHGPERRRVVLVVRGRVTGERDSRREQQQRGGAEPDRDATGQPTPDVETEGGCEERDENEQVSLLEPLRVGSGDLCSLEQQGAGQEDGDRGERE